MTIESGSVFLRVTVLDPCNATEVQLHTIENRSKPYRTHGLLILFKSISTCNRNEDKPLTPARASRWTAFSFFSVCRSVSKPLHSTLSTSPLRSPSPPRRSPSPQHSSPSPQFSGLAVLSYHRPRRQPRATRRHQDPSAPWLSQIVVAPS